MPALVGNASATTTGSLLDLATSVAAEVDDSLVGTTSSSLGSSSAVDWLDTDGGGSAGSSTSWLPSLVDSNLSLPGLSNVTGVVGLNVTSSSARYCEEWQAAQHTLFQTANLCYAAAFLVPHNFRLSVLVLRSLLCGGYLLFAVWAGVYVCAPDIFAWNVTFVAVNTTHVAYLAWKHWPPRIQPELRDLYTKVFLPLKMDKKHFQELVREASLYSLDEGIAYALEDSTPADERLSILLQGRLKVTCETNHLHYIYPNHFLDSPEWESCPLGSKQLFQVTITAVEPCRYLSWSRRRLQQVLKMHAFLDVVLYNLVGKDITYKLYSLNETLNPRRARASIDVSSWKDPQVPRSLSVDAVHMGTKGNLRSHLWPASASNARRNSSACSDSIGSSPARTSRYSHLSDPGPYRGSNSPSYNQSPALMRHVSPWASAAKESSQLAFASTAATKIAGAQQPLESSYPLHVAFETPV